MKALSFKKGVADRLAQDIREARRKILRRADPKETYELMVLADDVENLGRMDRLEALANRFEEGSHYLRQNLQIDTEEEAQEVANEMAADLRVMKSRAAEFHEEPVTEDRLRRAEEIFRRYGVELALVNRSGLSKDTNLN